jgi:transposase
MRKPIFVRDLTAEERAKLKMGVRSTDSFVRRRCQILLASARGERALPIARTLGCNDETVRYVIKGFNARGLAMLTAGSRRPHTIEQAFPDAQADQLKEVLHHSPRQYGKATSLWTLKLAAEVSFTEGLTAELVSDETIRATLKRLGIGWKRAKQWITSPDPEYARKKKASRPADPDGDGTSRLGGGV